MLAYKKNIHKSNQQKILWFPDRLFLIGKLISRLSKDSDIGIQRGTNMPDISILINLAEFYNVSIPEIIDGGRKSEKMNEEVKETVLKLSDYAETINQKIKIKLFWLTIAALLGMIAFLVIETLGLNTPDSLYEYIASAGLGLDFGMLIVITMYLSGVLGKIKARRMKLKNIH